MDVCGSTPWRRDLAVVGAVPTHPPSYKGNGQTNHIERFNNTLRRRLAQRVRKTLAFAKCSRMLEITFELFIHRYNAEIRLSYRG